MDQLIELMQFANEGLKNSKFGLDTYEDDTAADHGDGQQVGREEAYKAIINKCASMIQDRT